MGLTTYIDQGWCNADEVLENLELGDSTYATSPMIDVDYYYLMGIDIESMVMMEPTCMKRNKKGIV